VKKAMGILALLLGMAAGPLLIPAQAQAPGEPAAIGAIRWDAWYGEPASEDPGSPDPCTQVERTLSPAEYHWRVPFFGNIGEGGQVSFPEYTQEIFDREMEYAIEAGLDYFAYVWYLNIPGMERAHQYHTVSQYNTQVKMCSIFDGNALNQQNVRDEIRGMIGQGYWQTVQGGRPLMFYFQVDGAAMAQDIAAYRAICAELGIPAPYAVAMSGGKEMVTVRGADAVSSYAVSGSGGMKFTKLIRKARRGWDRGRAEGLQVVPNWSAGWNALPRHDNPVTWMEVPADSWVADGTPQEIARCIAEALAWYEGNHERSGAVIGYAWNEHDEGGWLCPTIQVDSRETGVPLKNPDGTWQIDDSRILAVKEIIASYQSGNLQTGGHTMLLATIGWTILGLLGLFIVITLIRAAFWKAKKVNVEPLPDEPVDEARAAARLSGAIQIPTIANDNDEGTDWAQFERFHAYLEESYPLIAQNLPREVVRRGSLLYHWKGRDPSLPPIALLSHIDVVPVTPGTEDDWTHPPFSGHNDGEFIWGRGAMDMKNQLICTMEAVETLLAEGFTPERDVYLCFGDNEEILSHENGARYLARALRERGVTRLESTLDEGGAMLPVDVKGILSGVLAGVGLAEKGHCNIEISVNAKGGHASQPPDHTALGELAQVIRRLEKHQFRARMTPLMRDIIDAAGRRLPYWLRIAVVNHRLLQPVLLAVMKRIPFAACMVRTTTAVTQATGSPAPNVLPQNASIVANFRMMPGITTNDLVAHIKKVARNKNIVVTVLNTNEASKYSTRDSKSFGAIARLVRNMHPDAILAPFLVMGGTDSIQYDSMCDHCYRFSPFLAPVELLLCTHATDERLPVAALGEGVRFFKYYIKDAAG